MAIKYAVFKESKQWCNLASKIKHVFQTCTQMQSGCPCDASSEKAEGISTFI